MKFQHPEEQRLSYRTEYLKALDADAPELFEEMCALSDTYLPILKTGQLPHMRRDFLNDRFIDWGPNIVQENGDGFLYAYLTDDWSFYGNEARAVTDEIAQLCDFFRDFRSEYSAIVNKYFLNDNWLEHHLRIFLQFRGSYGEAIEGIGDVQLFHAISIWCGPAFTFNFFGMRMNTEELGHIAEKRYTKAAELSFKKAWKSHLLATREYFTSVDGIKRSTRPHSYEYVNWLVLWNTGQMTKDEIRGASTLRAQNLNQSDLDRRFSTLEEFGLPYRREVSPIKKAI